MSGRIAYYGGIVNNNLDIFLNLTNKNSYPGIGDTIYDLTNQYNSTMFNSPTYNNDEYRYLNLTSTSQQYIDTFYSANNTNFTIELLFSPTVLSGVQVYVGKYNGISSQVWWIGINSSFRFSINNITINSIITPELNKLYLLTCVKNNTNFSMYINSTFQSSGTTTNNATPTSMFIGKFGTTSTFFSNINLLQFKYYSKSLSENEIIQNYNATKTRFGL